MGNLVSSATPRATLAGIDSYVGELPEITYEKSLGSSRFLKTIRCRHPQGLVVVKIFVKTDPTLSLKSVVKQLQNERDLIQGLPNVLANQQIIESDRAGYMIRQFIASNLYDRISNRPFLTNFEKKWVAFQLLTGVVEAHSRQVFHGDIKTENVFCTSWNWVYLADFSSFKPTYLPEDNPADFTFFFDTSARRICYLAPERFYESGESLSSERISKLTPEMDVFSLGCTIAEVFLEGTPVFTLAQLLQFRKGAYDPSVLLERIEDQDIRALVKHMIQLDPSMRLSAHEYLNKWRGTAFPEYFFSFLHPYVASLSDPYFASNMAQYHVFLANSANAVIADMDAKIDRIYFDFDKIAEALEIPNTSPPTTLSSSRLESSSSSVSSVSSSTVSMIDRDHLGAADFQPGVQRPSSIPKSLLPVHVSIPNFTSNITEIPKSVRAADAGLVFIAAVSAAIRNTLYPTSRLRGLDLLLALAIHVPDEQKLDRIVPYMVALLSDENPNVRVNALAALTQLLLMVKSITPSDAGIFPEYILPSLRRFTSDANVLARAAYAQCIPAIGKSSEVALQFLELSQMLKSESNLELDMDMNVYQMSYDANLRDLQDIIQEDVEALLIDSHPLVKRSLLTDMPRLCIFFGRQKANDVLLSHMITYLNDPDWSLRSAFCETIVGVGTFVGMRSLDEYILPLMVQALTDSEEYVVEKVLNSLTSLAELGLIAKTRLKELCSTVLPLACHPNRWIRYGVIAFLSSTAKLLPLIDVRCVLYPMVRPFLRRDAPSMGLTALLENIRPPVPRLLYEQTVQFAGRSNNDGRAGLMSIDAGLAEAPGQTGGERNDLLVRLRDLGMADEDKEKLFAMKYFISKASAARLRRAVLAEASELHGIDPSRVALRDHGVTLHTVFLTPPAQQQLAPRSRTASRQSMTGSGHIREGTDGRRSSRFSMLGTSMQHADSSPTLGQDDQGSPVLSSDADAALSSRRSIVRPRSEVASAGSVRRPSKTGSVGNYDLTADPAFVHAADGQEKYIRRVLEKKTKELFPPALPELGHKVTLASRAAAVDARLRRTRTGIAAQSELKGWKPKGILVAHFPEHVSQINCIAVAPDHSFFATCSDDGTVKIWDTNRLHTNVANRARITYAGLGGKVKALAFCESRHSIVSAADNGQIHINRVEYIKPQTGSLKYTGTPLVRAVTLRNEFAVLLDHSESETQSLLVYATTRGRLCGLDLRSMREVWGFQVPAHYGAVTALVTDPKRTWVMVGTHRGVLLLWDVRFQLCTKVWAHPSRARINKLAMYTYRSQTRAGVNAGGRLVAMAVGTATSEISVWNVSTGDCAEVFCVMSEASGAGGSRASIDVDNELMRAYGDGLRALEPPGAQDLIDATASLSLHSIPRHLGARSFTIHPEVPFMAAVGNDRKLRFWDLDKAEDSFVVSGLEDDAAMPNSQLYGDINFNVEYPAPQHFVPPAVGSSPAVSFYESARPPPANTSWSPLRNLPGMQSPDEQSARSKGTGSTASSSASQSGAGGSGGVAGSLGGGGGNRSSWPSDRQMASKGAELVTSAVPRRHLDGITDVAVTQFPHPMIITGSRDGIVKVWQ